MKVKRWLLGIVIATVSVISVCAMAFFTLTSPTFKIAGWQSLDLAKIERIYKTVTLKNSDGDIIVENIYSQNRIFTPIEDIPKHTKDAFISIEDKRFYKHNGVDYKRMLGALKNNIISHSLKEGASTITQQLIKNTHLSSKKTFTRKLQEIRIAKQLEKAYTKEKILEAYLNIVYFGNNLYGIGQAAHGYFGKDVSALTVNESAMLAGIINNPSLYNPIFNYSNAERRRNTVISRMLQNGKINKDLAESESKINTVVHEPLPNPFTAYIENVIAEASETLDCLPEEIFGQVSTIVVNADKRKTEAIYSSMSDILYKSDINMRVIVAENIASKIIADISNTANTPSVKRQPGSAIKPFMSYAPALEKKLVFPASMLNDEKTDFGGYSPKNFANKYYGNITVADSLKYSLNIPAVRLTDMAGITYSKAVASKFGIPFHKNDNGLALALGGMTDGVSLNHLVDAYATLSRGGLYERGSYISYMDADEKRIYKKHTDKVRAVGADTAYLLTDMMKECAKTGTAKRLNSLKNVAAKTGTVERGDKNSDAYCIAYTPKYTVAVWCGYDGEENIELYGGGMPTKIVKSVFEILNDKSEFEMPESVEKLDVDIKKLNEKGEVCLASPLLPPRYRAKFLFSKNNLPKKFSYPEIPYIFDDSLTDEFEDFQIVDSL